MPLSNEQLDELRLLRAGYASAQTVYGFCFGSALFLPVLIVATVTSTTPGIWVTLVPLVLRTVAAWVLPAVVFAVCCLLPEFTIHARLRPREWPTWLVPRRAQSTPTWKQHRFTCWTLVVMGGLVICAVPIVISRPSSFAFPFLAVGGAVLFRSLTRFVGDTPHCRHCRHPHVEADRCPECGSPWDTTNRLVLGEHTPHWRGALAGAGVMAAGVLVAL